MSDWDAISKASDAFGEYKDCAVRAVTVVSGFPYEHVHKTFTRCGRFPKCGTPLHVTRLALKSLQLQTEDVTDQFNARTVRTLERELPKKGRFLVRVNGHLLAAKDGKIIDWTKGRLHRIIKIEKVTF